MYLYSFGFVCVKSFKNIFLYRCRILETFAIIVSGQIFFQLFCSVLFLAIAALEMNLLLEKHDADMFLMLLALSVGIASIFIYCYFASKVSHSLQCLSDKVYQCLWYQMPVHIQNDLILVIGNLQRPYYFTGYKFIICSLETFLRVRNFKIFQ